MAIKKMDIITKTPNECSSSELSEFNALVLEGGEVVAEGLLERIKRAEKLIFVKDKNCIGVGAIKRPYDIYKNKVFKKSGVLSLANEHIFELGWILSRRKGVGNIIMQSIIATIGNSSCFATTRENNGAMHHLFNKYGFAEAGEKYKSDNGEYSLVLYVYKP